jgi:hypothetical protein
VEFAWKIINIVGKYVITDMGSGKTRTNQVAFSSNLIKILEN